MRREGRYVFAALPQWRDFNWKDAQAIEKVLAKATLVDLLL
jgi:hypothetical protein